MGVNYYDYAWGCLTITRVGEWLTITKDGGQLTITMVIASSRDLDALWGSENFWFRAANLCMSRKRFQSFHQLLKGVSDSIVDQTTLIYYLYYDANFRARWMLCQVLHTPYSQADSTPLRTRDTETPKAMCWESNTQEKNQNHISDTCVWKVVSSATILPPGTTSISLWSWHHNKDSILKWSDPL